ncbi:uroporphyrinogen-III synthase [Alkalibacillus flavidus]|uniref:Uroporphyrinogen-III synthase n=1 Tax=Alkalibacillus flavidus TaxID=546021 RepID=A0ABV2KSJ8_9BACI
MVEHHHERGIVLSRSLEQAPAFQMLDRKLDTTIHGVPLITFDYVEPSDTQMTKETLLQHDWVIFTSHNGIYYFMELLKHHQISPDVLNQMKLVTVGDKTKQTLNSYGFDVEFVPSVFDAETLAEQLIQQRQMHYPLLIKGTKSRAVLDQALDDYDIKYRSLTVYKTVTNWNEKSRLNDILAEGPVDAFVFTSPSSIDGFLDMMSERKRSWFSLPCFAIGQTTADYATKQGFTKVYKPSTFTLEGLAYLVEQYLKGEII